MRTIDSGHSLTSPITGPMPHRSPQFLGTTQKGTQGWKITIQTPAYFQKLHLFILDLTGPSKATIPVPFTAQSGKKNEEMVLEIAVSDLNIILKPQHRYQWVLIPEGSANIYVESEEIFSR